jgi:HK97 family phage major capsid protein
VPTFTSQAESLTQKAATLRSEAVALAEKPEPTAADLASIKKATEEADGLDKQAADFREIAATAERNRAALAGYATPQPRRTASGAGVEPVVSRASFLDDPMRGFRSGKDFFLSVMRARSGRVNDNLKSLVVPAGFQSAAGSDEQGIYSDPFGGFFVPRAMESGVRTVGFDLDPLAGLTQKVPMSSPKVGINARVDKNHATSVTGGLVVYRRAETGTVTASRMQFEQITLDANSLMGVAYVTEELLRASPESFVAMLDRGFRDEFAAKAMAERLDGNGAGQPVGVNNAACKIDVDKETNQPAATIVWANLVKMRARCWGYGSAVWVANPDTLPALLSITQPGSTIPLFTQDAQGVDRIFGRPVIFTEFAKTLGTAGDILLLNLGEYLEGEYAGIEGASSVHVRFAENEQAFRFTKMNAGAPWWASVLTPRNGATMSPIVRLAQRA